MGDRRDPPAPLGRLEPGQSRDFRGNQDLPGHFLVVQKAELGSFAFSLRIRDISRSSENEGTEIPVVPQDEWRNTPIRLLDVPLNSTSRAALRMFEMHVEPFSTPVAYVTLRGPGTASLRVELSRDQTEYGVLTVPGYATVNDLRAAAGLPEGSYHVEVVPQNYTGWAFVAVTNNETQVVTAITPK